MFSIVWVNSFNDVPGTVPFVTPWTCFQFICRFAMVAELFSGVIITWFYAVEGRVHTASGSEGVGVGLVPIMLVCKRGAERDADASAANVKTLLLASFDGPIRDGGPKLFTVRVVLGVISALRVLGCPIRVIVAVLVAAEALAIFGPNICGRRKGWCTCVYAQACVKTTRGQA